MVAAPGHAEANRTPPLRWTVRRQPRRQGSCHAFTLLLTVAPASPHTRANVVSVEIPPDRNLPERGHAAR